MTFRDVTVKALTKAGKQESLAIQLDLSPSSLSKKLSGETGWSETEINKLIEIAECEVIEKGRIKVLMQTLKVVLNEVEGDLS